MSNSIELLTKALRAGRFVEAAAHLPHVERSTEGSVLAVEAAYFLGDAQRVRHDGRRLVDSQSVTASQAARCALAVGRQFSDDGLLDEAIHLYGKALSQAQQANADGEVCLASAYLLERTCDSRAFDASLPLAAQTRKAAAKCGDPQVIAAAHITFGRLEARGGRFVTARRHYAIARELLRQDPNLRLSVTIDNDETTVLVLLGEIATAVDVVTRASATASESGWPRGVAAAAANLAYILVAQGKAKEAEEQLRLAVRHSFNNSSYDLALAETRALIAFHQGRHQDAEDILASHEIRPRAGGVWYELETQITRARNLLRLERWTDALSCADAGIRKADSAGDQKHAVALMLVKTEALIALRSVEPSVYRLFETDQRSWPVTLLGSFWVVLGKVLRNEGLHERGRAHVARAVRIFQTIGNKAAEVEADGSLVEFDSTTDENLVGREHAQDDSLMALLELADYPHILAREAFAVMEHSGCSFALALLGTSRDGTRVIETRGWDQREAVAAWRKPEGIEILTIGKHSDETLQLVSRIRPDVQYRYAFGRIRKIISVATDLRRYRDDEKQRAALWPAEALEPDSDSIWASEQMSEVLNIARRIAPTPLSLLLTGETGTGKEMLARAIHRASDRADRVFLPFNCTAVPRDMLESQLFGYRKGAFTGADTSFQGVIRSAAGGTLFLDEIADVSLDVQPKLLRFLETHEIHPLGEPQPIKVDVRIVAATNANLEQLVADGRFREDLFYRLNVVRLRLPPLRERREEIPPLVHHYLRKFGDEQKKGQLILADETLEYLLLYAWPGNIRQLANEVRRMVALADADSALTPSLLSPEIQASRRTIPATEPVASEPEVRVRLDQPLPLAVEMLEQTMIRSALRQSRGRVEEAAKLLGISRKGLFLKRRRWNLDQQQAS
jgi:DNA-binding NtrC family response regulator